MGEKDDYDGENSWISDGLPSSSLGRETYNVIKKLANSLVYIDTGHPSVSFIKLTKIYMHKYQSKIRVHLSILPHIRDTVQKIS